MRGSQMDEILAGVADQIKNFAVIFLVDISEVPDFNTMCECQWVGRLVGGYVTHP
jgi:hypothetical protein